MQPLGTKINHATSQDKKKSRNIFGQKKITQPLETKKSGKLLGQKEITQPVRTKKITQPLGTK